MVGLLGLAAFVFGALPSLVIPDSNHTDPHGERAPLVQAGTPVFGVIGHILTDGYVYNTYNIGDLLFTAEGDAGFRCLNVSNPADIQVIYENDTYGVVYDVQVRNNYLYVADGSNGLLIYDISDVQNPVYLRNVTTMAGAYPV